MCDFSLLLGYLLTGEVAITVAFVLCGVAIGLNSSFFGAPGAPIPFGLSAFSAGVAAAGFGTATAMLGSPECMNAQCAAQSSAALAQLAVVTGLMTVALIAGVVALAASAVPVVGAVAMTVFGAALVAASLALPGATIAIRELQRCMEQAASTAADVAVAGGVIIGLIGLIFIGVSIATERGPGPERDPFPKD
jgi:hypothetical protein